MTFQFIDSNSYLMRTEHKRCLMNKSSAFQCTSVLYTEYKRNSINGSELSSQDVRFSNENKSYKTILITNASQFNN